MDEVWLRAGLVCAAFLIAGVVVLLRRSRERSVRSIRSLDLAPGMYLFTSEACGTCDAARSEVVGAVGADGFTEITWEETPGRFTSLGVDAVPAVLLVDGSGHGRLYPGPPGRALRDI